MAFFQQRTIKAFGFVQNFFSAPSESVEYQLKDKDLDKIHKAAAQGDLTKLKQLTANPKNNINQLDKKHRSALHIACAAGHVDTVRFLVEKKAKLDQGDDQHRSALMKAVQGKHDSCVMILLKNQANPNKVDIKGNTALHYSTSVDIAQLLLRYEAKINASNKEGLTPLCLAVYNKHIEMAAFLIKQGANVNATDKNKRSPLMMAAANGQQRILNDLLRNGADVTLKDLKGWSAKDYAVKSGHDHCVFFLTHPPSVQKSVVDSSLHQDQRKKRVTNGQEDSSISEDEVETINDMEDKSDKSADLSKQPKQQQPMAKQMTAWRPYTAEEVCDLEESDHSEMETAMKQVPDEIHSVSERVEKPTVRTNSEQRSEPLNSKAKSPALVTPRNPSQSSEPDSDGELSSWDSDCDSDEENDHPVMKAVNQKALDEPDARKPEDSEEELCDSDEESSQEKPNVRANSVPMSEPPNSKAKSPALVTPINPSRSSEPASDEELSNWDSDCDSDEENDHPVMKAVNQKALDEPDARKPEDSEEELCDSDEESSQQKPNVRANSVPTSEPPNSKAKSQAFVTPRNPSQSSEPASDEELSNWDSDCDSDEENDHPVMKAVNQKALDEPDARKPEDSEEELCDSDKESSQEKPNVRANSVPTSEPPNCKAKSPAFVTPRNPSRSSEPASDEELSNWDSDFDSDEENDHPVMKAVNQKALDEPDARKPEYSEEELCDSDEESSQEKPNVRANSVPTSEPPNSKAKSPALVKPGSPSLPALPSQQTEKRQVTPSEYDIEGELSSGHSSWDSDEENEFPVIKAVDILDEPDTTTHKDSRTTESESVESKLEEELVTATTESAVEEQHQSVSQNQNLEVEYKKPEVALPLSVLDESSLTDNNNDEQLATTEDFDDKPTLERNQLGLQTEVANLKIQLQQEQENTRHATMMYTLMEEELQNTEKLRQCEIQEKEMAKLSFRNLEVEMTKLVNNMKQLEEGQSDREKELLQQTSTLQEQIAILSRDLERAKAKKSRVLEENQTLKEQLKEAQTQVKADSEQVTALQSKIAMMKKRFKYEISKLVTDGERRKVSSEDQLSRKGQSEYEMKTKPKLLLRLSKLEKENRYLISKMEDEKNKSAELALQKKTVEVSFNQAMNRNIEFRTENLRLRSLIKIAKKKLRDRDMEEKSNPPQDPHKVNDLQLQLEKKTLRCSQLEKDNHDLRNEFLSLKISEQFQGEQLTLLRTQMQRQIQELEREVQQSLNLRDAIQSEADMYRNRAAKLEEANHHLSVTNSKLRSSSFVSPSLDGDSLCSSNRNLGPTRQTSYTRSRNISVDLSSARLSVVDQESAAYQDYQNELYRKYCI